MRLTKPMCLPNKIKFNYEEVIDRQNIPKGSDLHKLVESAKPKESNEDKHTSSNQAAGK